MASFFRHTQIILLLTLCGTILHAQSIEDASFDNYHDRSLVKGNAAQPYRHIRENDVVWEKLIWRTIDFREKFNQFFFYPIEHQGILGRKNFAYLIWDAVVAGELPIYEDDEMKVPLDHDQFVFRYNRVDTVTLEIYDDNGEAEYVSVPRKQEFYSEDIMQVRIKEVWYIDKQADKQESRIVALTMVKDQKKWVEDELVSLGSIDMFWIPMQSPIVRHFLAQNEAYFEDNIIHLPTWEYIFNGHVYSSFITREDNRYNRTISSYLTGQDALLEAERIEDHLLNISEDMWEY